MTTTRRLTGFLRIEFTDPIEHRGLTYALTDHSLLEVLDGYLRIQQIQEGGGMTVDCFPFTSIHSWRVTQSDPRIDVDEDLL